MELPNSEKPKIRSRSGVRSDDSSVTSSSQDNVTAKSDTVGTGGGDYLKGDRLNIVILLFLYLLQGVPLGLSAAIPIILQNRHISYEEQAEFSFVTWPFSLKLLWAPVVDSIFWAKFGRRKSWLIPVQYLIGIFMLITSLYVDEWIGDEEGTKNPNIKYLTLVFFFTNFLAATQDIAVDGWALTMLQRKHVGHASTCNTVGQTAGYFLGYVVFVALVSPEFCNKWIRSVPEPTGVITFSEFVWFWGVTFIVCTTLIALFKSDKCPYAASEEGSPKLTIKESYVLLVDIFKLVPIKQLVLLLLTCKVGFAACDAVSPLKLIEAGVTKEKIALIAVPLIPLQVILPFVISKYIVGPRPFDVFLHVIPYRLLIGLLVALLVFVTPHLVTKDNMPLYYYGLLLIVYGLHQMVLYCMFVSCMAFFARISDPRSGGVYMTLLNTVSNLGSSWPSTVALWMVDKLTWRNCHNVQKCTDTDHCTTVETCSITLDGYYVEIVFSTAIGLLWLRWAQKKITRLQNLEETAWKVHSRLVSKQEFAEV